MKELIGSEHNSTVFLDACNEVKIMKALRHKNIIGFIDAFIHNHNFYIIMPIAGN